MQGIRLLAGTIAVALAFPAAALGARHVYVSNLQSPGTANVAGFTLANNGTLQPNGAPAGTGMLGVSGLVSAPDGSHLYGVNNDNPGTVGTLAVAADGTLSSQGAPVATGGNQPRLIAIAPDGKHLYIQHTATADLSVLSVAANGTPAIQSSGIAAGTAPTGLAVAPDGRFLYVADFNLGGAGSVLRFSIGSNGGLTPVGAPTPTGGMAADQITITPDGRFLYVDNANSKDVTAFAISAATGALTPVGTPVATGSAEFPAAITVTPDGQHLYVANSERTLSGFSINQSSGALTALSGSPYPVGTDTSHAGLASSPDGKQILESLSTSSSLRAFNVGADGSLNQANSISSGGLKPDSESVVSQPNQGPTAAFTTRAQRSGKVHFNANTSKDSDGKVATYRWDFGDGSSTDTDKAGSDHVYALAGKYTATLTAIDNEGCSTSFVFTGQSALCNGSSAAKVSHSFNSSVQFTLSAVARQRTRVVRATGLCPTEACRVQVGGSVKVGSRRVQIKRTRRSLAAGIARTWRIKLPLKARKALLSGRNLNVKITAGARAFTNVGRNTSRQRNIKVRGRHQRH